MSPHATNGGQPVESQNRLRYNDCSEMFSNYYFHCQFNCTLPNIMANSFSVLS